VVALVRSERDADMSKLPQRTDRPLDGLHRQFVLPAQGFIAGETEEAALMVPRSTRASSTRRVGSFRVLMSRMARNTSKVENVDWLPTTPPLGLIPGCLG
jgi:hypothetical protein